MKKCFIFLICLIFCASQAYAMAPVFGGMPKTYSCSIVDTNLVKTTPDSFFSQTTVDLTHAGDYIDLSEAYVTFDDEFRQNNLTSSGDTSIQKNKWYTTPSGGYGHQSFVDGGASATNVFDYTNGILTFTMSYANTSWQTGQLYSATTNYYNTNPGCGFAQKYGYFEVSLAAPLPAPGDNAVLWEGFWLKNSQSLYNGSAAYVELDGPEIYSGDSNRIHLALHRWKGSSTGITNNLGFGCIVNKIGECSGSDLGSLTPFDGAFHKYGILITPTRIAYYYDRQELMRLPTIDEARHPFYMILDLALCDTTVGCPYNPSSTSNVYQMKLDYVRVWQWPEYVGQK